MGGTPDECPVCSTPYVDPAPTDHADVVLPRPPEVDLRAPAEEQAVDLTDATVGAEELSADPSHAAKPVRTRPKTPLRPYVPPAPPQVAAPAAAANPFAPRPTTPTAPPLPSAPAGPAAPVGGPSPAPRPGSAPPSSPAAPTTAAPATAAIGAPPEATPSDLTPSALTPPAPPVPAAPPQPRTWTAVATGSQIEAPAWAALPPPSGSPFTGIAPPGSSSGVAPGTTLTPPAPPVAPVAPSATRLGPTAPPPPAEQASAAGLAARPDPYAQISNPLHTGWGAATPAAPPMVHMTPPTRVSASRRSPWVRRTVAVVLLALLAGGIWWQRDRIGDAVDDLGDRLSGDSSALVVPGPPPPPVDPVD